MPEREEPKPAEKWKDSCAKKKFTKDTRSCKVPPEWKPKQVLTGTLDGTDRLLRDSSRRTSPQESMLR
jgi:hypothetical protein